ncbi:PGDYG domain-containing protein [Lacinutrix iliipiscaria]|uniref:PGDYG domain-containing protein n=1 Tax=Lacinutrix iliipiscaria TaxID=1230532 RepID=A0ABW5WT67_9FLAO
MIKFNSKHLPELEFKNARKKPIVIQCYQMNEPFEVETLEGVLTGKKGDWLMVGIDGELYPCDQEIFDKTYNIVE